MNKLHIDNVLDELYRKLGTHDLLPAKEFYSRASHSVGKANKVILAHLGIKNRVSVVFKEMLSRPGMIMLPNRLALRHILLPINVEMDEKRLWSSPVARWIPVRIEIDGKYRHDMHALGAILAHEDTHLLLKLLRCEGDEIYTDMAAIVLGLGELMAKGRNRPIGVSDASVTETIGYLDDESFNYVYGRTLEISQALKEGKPPYMRPELVQASRARANRDVKESNLAGKGGKGMAKIKCPNCGFENEEGVQFCDQCATELAGVAPIEEPVAPAGGEGAPVSAEEVPEVARPPQLAKARLVVKRTGRVGQEFPIDQESMNVGRWDADSGIFPEIDLSEDDPGAHISRKHARIFLKEGEYFIEDLGSTNGTFVNKGPRLTPGSPQELQNGDEIIMGRTFFTFVVE